MDNNYLSWLFNDLIEDGVKSIDTVRVEFNKAEDNKLTFNVILNDKYTIDDFYILAVDYDGFFDLSKSKQAALNACVWWKNDFDLEPSECGTTDGLDTAELVDYALDTCNGYKDELIDDFNNYYKELL